MNLVEDGRWREYDEDEEEEDAKEDVLVLRGGVSWSGVGWVSVVG